MTINDNQFEEDKNSSHQDSEKNLGINQGIVYTLSMQNVLASLDTLKYLDYLPIDEKRRKHFKEAFSFQAIKSENTLANKKTQEQQEEENNKLVKLQEACAEEMYGFFDQILLKIEQDLEEYPKLEEFPDFGFKFAALKKSVNEQIEVFMKKIIEIDEAKKSLREEKLKKIEISLENFVEKSKEMIKEFKDSFKDFIRNKLPSIVNKPIDDLRSKIQLDELKKSLMDEEIHLKKIMREKLTDVANLMKEKNNDIMQQTGKMKEELDNLRKFFVQEIKEKFAFLENQLKSKQENRVDEEEDWERVTE